MEGTTGAAIHIGILFPLFQVATYFFLIEVSIIQSTSISEAVHIMY